MNDASYKRLLTHRRIIEDLLVGFIAPRRPAGWADALDFDSLREGPTENVDDDLSRRLTTPSGPSTAALPTAACRPCTC